MWSTVCRGVGSVTTVNHITNYSTDSTTVKRDNIVMRTKVEVDALIFKYSYRVSWSVRVYESRLGYGTSPLYQVGKAVTEWRNRNAS